MNALASALLAALAVAAQAAPQPTTWTLATADTELTLGLRDAALTVTSLRHPGQRWNWLAAPTRVPLPAVGTAVWRFRGAAEDRTQGQVLTLRFDSAEPALELTSVWRAWPGPGPVENEVTVVNRSAGDVVFPATLAAAQVALRADGAVTLHRARKTNVGVGEVFVDEIGANAAYATDNSIIPFILLGVGEKHGAYFGFEWELGGFRVNSGANPREFGVAVHPVTENVTRAPGATFLVPSVYYGTYQGDLDDGSNRFKRWFWNHKITRSLHDHADEPWSEVCMQDITTPSGSAGVVGGTPQSVYDRLAATGVECVKMDFWDGSGQGWYTNRDWMYHREVWPNGFDFAAKAHRAGLKASLYMGGTYNDVDLTTIAGRDAELEAVLSRYDQGWFDMWRTDLYTAPREPMPQTYEGVTNFLHIQDRLIASRPGYRYENCCNGGTYKGFAICRRMTYCTMNDDDHNPWRTRTTYYSNSYAINPVQLKSDIGAGPDPTTLFRSAIMGPILTWAFDTPLYREHIALYKRKQRPILRGANVYHILPMADGANWDGLEFYNPDIRRGSVFLFKPGEDVPDSRVIRLKGLEPKGVYTLTFQDRKPLNCVRTGAQLRTNGIYVTGMTGANASEIIWIEETPKAKLTPEPAVPRAVVPKLTSLPLRADQQLPEALRQGLTFWVDANQNVGADATGHVQLWKDARDTAPSDTHPRARQWSAPARPVLVTGGAEVNGLRLVDFGKSARRSGALRLPSGGLREAAGDLVLVGPDAGPAWHAVPGRPEGRRHDHSRVDRHAGGLDHRAERRGGLQLPARPRLQRGRRPAGRGAHLLRALGG
ncbi:MAG: hypothetical protein HZB16_20795 [Armatimonadetes bacterium]|nr:hypothetical protein [Armatimonadota bacterium]